MTTNRKQKAAEFVGEGFNINITGRNVLITDPMKDYAMDKISKIERFTNRFIDVNVIMDIQKLDHRVDIILKVDHILIKCQGSSENMYASIDQAVDKLQAQLRRYKRRIREHHAKGVAEVEDMTVNVLQTATDQELNEINDEIESESVRSNIDKYSPHKIVSQEIRPLKTLTFQEAIMKMELSGEHFLIFRSEEDQKLKVLYRRDDGHYGMIEPEK